MVTYPTVKIEGGRDGRVIAEKDFDPEIHELYVEEKPEEGDDETLSARASLEEHTVPQLREMADNAGIEVPSNARKDDIIDALLAE